MAGLFPAVSVCWEVSSKLLLNSRFYQTEEGAALVDRAVRRLPNCRESFGKLTGGGSNTLPSIRGLWVLKVPVKSGLPGHSKPRVLPCNSASSQLLKRVVIVVVIIERKFLVFVQDLVEAKLELIRAIRGLYYILNFG